MFRKISAVSVALVLGLSLAAAAGAQEKKESGFSEWLKAIQRKIDQIVPKKSIPMSTGVAGVRGAKEDAQVKLYWKGKKGDEAVTEDELKEFKEGVAFAEKGDKAGAIKEFEEFLKQLPDSPLVPDAKKALDLAKAEAQEAKPAQ